jgi:quercetin dioxygenase-like cupin family protein
MSNEIMKLVIKTDELVPFEQPQGFLNRLLAVVDGFSVMVTESVPGTTFDAVHPEAELIYVLQGEIEYDNGRKVKANEAVVNLPNLRHSGTTAGDKAIRMVIVLSPPPKTHLEFPRPMA